MREIKLLRAQAVICGTKATSNLKGVMCCYEAGNKGHLKPLEGRLLEGPPKWGLLCAIWPIVALLASHLPPTPSLLLP